MAVKTATIIANRDNFDFKKLFIFLFAFAIIAVFFE